MGRSNRASGQEAKTLRAFTHARLITPVQSVSDGTLITTGRTIQSFGESSVVKVPKGADVIDCTGMLLVPGLIDLHLHGGGGYDLSSGEGLLGAARFHASRGTTSMVPALCPDSLPALKEQLGFLGRGYPGGYERPLPEILGLYMEGPFLNENKSGAFDPGSLRQPDAAMVKECYQASKGSLRLMTIAPELPKSSEAIEQARVLGVIPALGHTDATYEQVVAAVDEGVCHVTHVFNAMGAFHHREPGPAMAALLHPEVSVEVIVDGHHLHEATVRLIHRLKGAEHMILVSDAAPLAGRDRGSCLMGGREVEVIGGKAVNQEGNLAGSLVTMADALRKAVTWAGIPLREALCMATINPARLLGVADRKGQILAGSDADILLLNESLEVKGVYIGGLQVQRQTGEN